MKKGEFIRFKALFQIFLIIISTFTIYLINSKSVEAANVCCEKTRTGEYCKSTDASNCDPQFRTASTSCSQTSFCSNGCCISGLGCFKNTPRSNCESRNGAFITDANCNVPQCQKKCCILGNQCSYTSERSCRSIYSQYNNQDEIDLRNVATEGECSSICTSLDLGCCVSENSCKYTQRSDCQNRNFNSGLLCNSISNCSRFCTSHASKGCFNDNVYWFDSCGNREELIQQCDYAAGNKCAKVDNDFQCKTLDCTRTKSNSRTINDPGLGGLRRNGEAWCTYESGTGNYLDRPGSRHYRHYCVDGEEITEPCEDFRNDVCVQAVKNGFSSSNCLNNEVTDIDQKGKRGDIRNDYFSVPKGFKFWEEGLEKCNKASVTCKVVWVKKNRISSWQCKQNCECETQEWIDKVAHFCRSKGDCGAAPNVLGKKSSDGFVVGGDDEATPKQISGKKWQEFLKYGVFGKMIDFRNFVASQDIDLKKAKKGSEIGNYLSYGGLALGLLTKIPGISSALGLTYAASTATAAASTTSTAVSGAISLGATAGEIDLVAGASAVGVAGTGAAAGESSIGATLGLTTAGLVLAAVAIVLSIMGFLLSGGKVKVKEVKVDCNPWIAPEGGNDCDKCDKEFESCTEYKCRSLGQTCKYISDNEGTNRPKCYNSAPNDVTAPVITPWRENLTQDYFINENQNGYGITPLIKPYSLLSFGIKTDELAQCKYDLNHSIKFEDMSNFLGDSYYKKEHSISIRPLQDTTYNYYIKCKDPSGNANLKDYIIRFTTEKGPDLTPPVIEATSIRNNGFITYWVNQTPLTLYVNEPANCKWDKRDVDYDSMGNIFACDTETDQTRARQYTCLSVLDIVNETSNNYFFKCRDLSNNTNSESYPFTLIGTKQLNITSVNPKGEIYSSNVSLQVTTSFGAQNGIALCGYTNDLQRRYIEFFETNLTNHLQPLTLILGNYNYYVLCSDVAGNTANASTTFNIARDTTAATITFLSKTESLNIRFSEEVRCEFSNSTFTFGSGTSSGPSRIEQSLPLIYERFFVICRDNFDNDLKAVIHPKADRIEVSTF